MKKNLYTSRLRISLLFISFAGSWLLSLSQGFSPATQARLQKIIDSFQNNPANPYVGGLSVAIKVDQAAFWDGVTGYAARNVDNNNNLLPGGTPMSKSSLFRIYSVTKTFTAALVLDLAQQGAFQLDDPISWYIPISTINPQLQGWVTIRQLLAHESGFSDYVQEINLQLAAAAQPTKMWTLPEILFFTHQVNVPGTQRLYSSTNYVILGAIIEAVTRKPVEKLFRERYLDPLGLKSIYLAEREPIDGHGVLAAPHDNISLLNPVFQATGQPLFPNAYTNISRFPFSGIASLAFTGGGLVSNARDLADWGSALFGGRATSQSTLSSILNSISPTPDPDGDKLGYGVFTNTKISNTDFFVGHNGRSPGYRSLMFYQPDRKLTLVVLSNYYGGDPYVVAKALYEALPNLACGSGKEDKVTVCYNGHSLCIDRSEVQGFISKGAWVGTCDQASPVQDLVLKAQPNPTRTYFTVSTTSSNTTDKVTIRVYSLFGRIMETRIVNPNQTFQVGAGYHPGVYIIEATQGKQKEIKVVIKI